MHPRLRRLSADAQQLRTEFAGHPSVYIEPIGYEPAEQYRVSLQVPGVVLDPVSRQPVVVTQFVILIQLPAAYPREKPYCTMLSPIFHPNFGPNVGDEICIGDFWTSAQTLPDIVAKVGQMIQMQRYNIKSPLNAVAARWVAENEADGIFPVGTVALYQAEPNIQLGAVAPGGPASARSEPE